MGMILAESPYNRGGGEETDSGTFNCKETQVISWVLSDSSFMPIKLLSNDAQGGKLKKFIVYTHFVYKKLCS